MPRRPGELSVRNPLAPPPRPRVPGREEAFGPGGEDRPLAGPAIPIPPEQDEALLARYEIWKGQYNGSLPEFIVWEFLTIDKNQVVDYNFVFQHPMFGGRTRFGGFVLDFYLIFRNEGWRVQGERYHLVDPQSRARDAIAKVHLGGRGLRVIDLWESDLLQRRDFVLNLAWDKGVGVISKALP